MKKLIFVLLVFSVLKINAQFNPDYTDNYYTQIDHWTTYYDSVRVARYAVGDSSMRGIGYGKFQQWIQYWNNFMPPSGNFQDAFSILNDFTNQKKYEHILKTQTSGSNTNLLIVPPVSWTELGPLRQNDILGSSPTWYNPWSTPSQSDNFDYFGAHVGLVNRLYRHPTDANKIYALCGAGGVFMSPDMGANWTILGTDKIPSPNAIGLAIKPMGQQPLPGTEIMFLGLVQGNVYRSIDGGANWIEVGISGTNNYPPGFGAYSNSLPFFFFDNGGVSEEQTHKVQFVSTNSNSDRKSVV